MEQHIKVSIYYSQLWKSPCNDLELECAAELTLERARWNGSRDFVGLDEGKRALRLSH